MNKSIYIYIYIHANVLNCRLATFLLVPLQLLKATKNDNLKHLDVYIYALVHIACQQRI